MSKRLVSLGSQQAWFSPFVDVAVNGMMAMFVFLIVYIAAVPPRPDDTQPLTIRSTNLPTAVWYKGFETAISVSGGAGKYRFAVAPPLQSLGLLLETNSGVISGTPRPQRPAERDSALTQKFHVVVQDESYQRAEADLDLRIAPVAIPFDPERQPLRMAPLGERLPDAWIGRPYTNSLPVLGGLENYEYASTQESFPQGLIFRNGSITGTPENVAVPISQRFQDYNIEVQIKDQQSAFLPFEANRTPQLKTQLKLRVWRLEPIQTQNFLPYARAGRTGREYVGAIVAWGGSGRLKWSISGNPVVQAMLDSGNGLIRGRIPDGTASAGRPVELSFQAIVEDLENFAPSRQQALTITVLPPMQFLTPE